MNRRSLMVLLIGVIATLSGLAAAAWVQQDRCLDAGGRWVASSRACQLPTATETGWSAGAITAGIVVAILAGVMLFRALLFVTGRTTHRTPRS